MQGTLCCDVWLQSAHVKADNPKSAVPTLPGPIPSASHMYAVSNQVSRERLEI